MVAQFFLYGGTQRAGTFAVDNAHLGYVIEHALINKQTQVAQGFLYRLASQIQLGFYIRVCPGGGAPQGALAGDRRFLLGRQQARGNL